MRWWEQYKARNRAPRRTADKAHRDARARRRPWLAPTDLRCDNRGELAARSLAPPTQPSQAAVKAAAEIRAQFGAHSAARIGNGCLIEPQNLTLGIKSGTNVVRYCLTGLYPDHRASVNWPGV